MIRAAALTLCILLAGCGSAKQKATTPANGVTEAKPASAAPGLVDTLEDGGFPDSMDLMDNTPEVRKRFWASTTKSKCTPAAFYPGGKVPPAFYDYPPPPEWDRYTACLEAEARSEGHANVRLAVPADFPKTGTCYRSRIKELGRGTYVAFDNGISRAVSISDGAAYQLLRSRVGDMARICVVHIPENCPANDLRGIRYGVRNLRTGESWEMYGSISLHLCWGA